MNQNLRLGSLSNISIPAKSNLQFFNTNTGSRMEVLSNIDFKYEEDLTNKVMDIITRNANGNFDVVGKIHWFEEERVTLCGPNKVNRTVRTAILADDTAS